MSPAERDFYLDSHLNESGLYIIALGGGKPSSIRDQINKTTEFLQHAKEAGRIKPGEVLLVLGAGVAGVSAAWKAVTAGVNVVLYELKSEPFSAQEACDTRWLHPNEYRWPQEDCHHPGYPLRTEADDAPPMLEWHADVPARVVADQWRPQFTRWSMQYAEQRDPDGYLAWEPEAESEFPDDLDLNGHAREALANGACQMALLCVGAKELCAVKDSRHRSYRFWEPDPYGIHLYDQDSSPSPGWRTLVSGGGDGALQDFLRIACQRAGHGQPVHVLQLLRPLLPALENCAAYRPVEAAFAHWREENHRPPPEDLWLLLERFVADLTATPQAVEIAARLDRVMDPDLLAGRKILHLNLAEGRFEGCYTLNALLVRLFDWRLRRAGLETVFQPGAFVRTVRSVAADHRCDHDPGPEPAGCLLKVHEVTFLPRKDGTAVAPRTYHVIVIRHGVVPLAKARSQSA